MTTRINGLSGSGLDIDTMVKDMMKAETMKVDKVKQQKQLSEWKRDDYREINTKLLALRNSAFDMKLQGTFQAKKVSSSDDTVLTSTAASTASTGNYSVNVTSLASGVNKGSSAAISSGDKGSNLATQFGLSGSVAFTLEGYDGTVNVSKTFTFDTAAKSMSDVVSEINNAGIGMKASYDANVDRFFLSSSGTGSNYRIHATADANNFLTSTLKLGLTVDANATPVAADQGTNANIDFNGSTGLEFASNQFSIAGINFNLKHTGSAQLTTQYDTDATVTKIKAFVEAYNNSMDLISTQTSEKRYRDYTPLSDEQKVDMKENDITLWETKAKSGMLQGDRLLSGVYNQTRSAAMGTVNGLPSGSKYNSLSAIGINTGSWQDNGKLNLDEDKLRKALADDPEGVMKLFTQTQATGTTTDTRGIAARLYDQVNSAMTSIKGKAGSDTGYTDVSTIGKQLTDFDTRIDAMNTHLQDVEDRYYKQFTAMETALSKMNNQSAWLTQQFSSSSS